MLRTEVLVVETTCRTKQHLTPKSECHPCTHDPGISHRNICTWTSRHHCCYFPLMVLYRAITWFLSSYLIAAVIATSVFVSTGCWFCHWCRHFNFRSAATLLTHPIPLPPPPLALAPFLLIPLLTPPRISSFKIPSSSSSPSLRLDFLRRFGRSIYCSKLRHRLDGLSSSSGTKTESFFN